MRARPRLSEPPVATGAAPTHERPVGEPIKDPTARKANGAGAGKQGPRGMHPSQSATAHRRDRQPHRRPAAGAATSKAGSGAANRRADTAPTGRAENGASRACSTATANRQWSQRPWRAAVPLPPATPVSQAARSGDHDGGAVSANGQDSATGIHCLICLTCRPALPPASRAWPASMVAKKMNRKANCVGQGRAAAAGSSSLVNQSAVDIGNTG